jgi:hypothetical protein
MAVKKTLIVALCASLGFAYYYFTGCTSGKCPITGNPYISTLYGALVGFVLVIPGRRRKHGDEKNKTGLF